MVRKPNNRIVETLPLRFPQGAFLKQIPHHAQALALLRWLYFLMEPTPPQVYNMCSLKKQLLAGDYKNE